MILWNRLQLALATFGAGQPDPAADRAAREAAAEAGLRWVRAARAQPELMGDVIRLSGMMVAQPFQAGEVADLDPYRLAYEAGRRDLALQLTALMGLSPAEMKTLMEMTDA